MSQPVCLALGAAAVPPAQHSRVHIEVGDLGASMMRFTTARLSEPEQQLLDVLEAATAPSTAWTAQLA